ncbi:MAG TPA: calcium-binding protein [Thermoanaerobaculia bacterium]
MKNQIHLGILLCLGLVATLGSASPAAAQTCMGFTCTIVGTPGSDVITGTPSADVICPLTGNDTVYGAGGSDKICGDGGTDQLYGQGGSDLIDGGSLADWIDGGDGSDFAIFAVAITADLTNMNTSEGDSLISIENLSGSPSADTLIGDSGNNHLIGQGGNDILIGRGGSDILEGRNGTDKAVYETAITASLTTGSASDGDMLSTIENLTGSNDADVLEGDGNNNVLEGGSGADYLDGKGGTDTCNGGLPLGPLGGKDQDTCTIDCETATGCTVF